MARQARVLGFLLFALVCGGLLSVGPQCWTSRAAAEVVEKRCGNCQREVPLSSHVGQRCPHCGVYWGYDDTSYTSGSSSPRRVPEVSLKYGDETFTATTLTSNSSLMVPVRTFENFGVVVEWTGSGTTLTKGYQSVTMVSGSSDSGRWSPAPRMRRGTLYVPLRAVAGALGLVLDKQDDVIVVGERY